MACFLVPMAVGIVTTVCRKSVPANYHIDWLNMLLWGGVAALALEHVSHQEIVPYFPFLTAMSNAADTATMLYEMATIGGGMLLACLVAWAVMVLVYNNYAMKNKTAQTA